MYEETYQMGPSGEMEKVIARDKPDVPEARSALVKDWETRVAKRRDYLRDNEFKRVREDQDFADGYQVDGQTAEAADQYVANLALRHINERVATLYAKNPTAVAKRTQRLDSALWDGQAESVTPVDQRMAMSIQSGMEPLPEDLAFMAEVSAVLERRKMLDGIGKTLELLFNHFMREGTPPFKTSAKQLVRRVETCAVGYIKLGFQRVMERNNEIAEQIADFSQQLAHIEALAADMADEEFDEHDKRAEALRQSIAAMQSQVEIITREGLVFDFPEATAIIPGPGTKHIRGFIGTPWIAEEHIVTPQEIKERFGIDIGSGYSVYKPTDAGADCDEPMCRWYEIYDLRGGVVRHIVEGYCDFLEEPKAPPIFMEQGHPYFALTFNNLESRKTCIPPSDVRLIMPMCKEYNRSREALRKHRIANRPAYLTATGTFDENDLMKLGAHQDSEIIEMKVPVGTNIGQTLSAKPTIPIDPAIVDTEHLYTDILRVSGNQEANFGGTSGATATESSIAESSRMTNVGSNVDDLDDFLTAVARAAGQLMLAEMSVEQVKRIAGAGAIWPDLSRSEIAEEIGLEIKAGSSGAPNHALELANFERAAPFLLQIPGIDPKKLGEYVLERLETGIDLDEWQVEGLPSIQAMNAMSKAAPPPGATGDQPEQQGAQGAQNAPAMPGPQAGQPMFPAPGEQGMGPGGMMQ